MYYDCEVPLANFYCKRQWKTAQWKLSTGESFRGKLSGNFPEIFNTNYKYSMSTIEGVNWAISNVNADGHFASEIHDDRYADDCGIEHGVVGRVHMNNSLLY